MSFPIRQNADADLHSMHQAVRGLQFSFLPKAVAPDLTMLTPEYFHKMGIRLLMLDFDNTIVPYTTDIPTDAVQLWLNQMKQSDISICVVSNSRNDRVPHFCHDNDIPCVTRAGKPGIRGVRECLRMYNCTPKEAALVGDQIYTDVLAANCAGLTSILVHPIHNHNFWLKARHVLELPFIFAARKRRVA